MIFHNPRVMTLFTGARATCAFNADKFWKEDVVWNLEKILDLIAQGNISHVILAKDESATCKAIGPIVRRNPDLFAQSYRNSGYQVYRIQQNVTTYENEPTGDPEGLTDGRRRKPSGPASPTGRLTVHSLVAGKS